MNNNTLNYNQDPHRPLQDNTAQPQLLQPNRQIVAQPAQYTLISHPTGHQQQTVHNIGAPVQQNNAHLLTVGTSQDTGAQQISNLAPAPLAPQEFHSVAAPIAIATRTYHPAQHHHHQVHQTIPAHQQLIQHQHQHQHQHQQVLLQPQPQPQHILVQQQPAQVLQHHQLPMVQHQFNPQQANQALLQTFMNQKAQLAAFESQLRPRFLPNQSAEPMLQPQLISDPRLMMGQVAAAPVLQNPLLALNSPPNQQVGMMLPSPHELTFRDETRRMRGGVIEPFPEKLHRLLLEVEAVGRLDVISFIAGGKAFAIHNPEIFFKEIVPKYFRQSRLSSFKRQLNLYGFELINTGPERGGYFHELFVKDRPELCRQMRRVAIKLQAKYQQEKKEQQLEKERQTDPHEVSATDQIALAPPPLGTDQIPQEQPSTDRVKEEEEAIS